MKKEKKDTESPVNGQEPIKSMGMLNSNPASLDVVLSNKYVSAKNNAVEQPINLSAQPPINFGVVIPGIYRSGYPEASDFPFIQSLKLKTIVTLVNKDMPDGYQQFMDKNGITHRVFDMAGTKKEVIPLSLMRSIATVVLNRENHPLLIHCNHGKHRTGCVVAVIRKHNAWEVNAIIKEYTQFAEPKVRDTDIDYIRNFQVADISCVSTRLRTRSKAKNLPIGTTFSYFIFLAFAALCIWIITGLKLFY